MTLPEDETKFAGVSSLTAKPTLLATQPQQKGGLGLSGGIAC
jgi:hypothetical protein